MRKVSEKGEKILDGGQKKNVEHLETENRAGKIKSDYFLFKKLLFSAVESSSSISTSVLIFHLNFILLEKTSKFLVIKKLLQRG